MRKRSTALAACALSCFIFATPSNSTLLDIHISGKMHFGTLCDSTACLLDRSKIIDLAGRDFTAAFTVDTSRGRYRTGYEGGWYVNVGDGSAYDGQLGPTKASIGIDGVGFFSFDGTHSYAERLDRVPGSTQPEYEQYSASSYLGQTEMGRTRDITAGLIVRIQEDSLASAPYGGWGTLFSSLEFGDYNRPLLSSEATVSFSFLERSYGNSGVYSSYSTFYQISAETTGNLSVSTGTGNPPPPEPIRGSTAGDPFMPNGGNAESGYVFTYHVVEETPFYYDPLVATGYDFLVDGANIVRALFPTLLNDADGYQIYDLSWNLLGTVSVGGFFDFTTPVSGFHLRGIDPANLLDPNSATAFVYGLVFDQAGLVTVTQTPFAEDHSPAVPEPRSWMMTIAGFGVIGTALRRTRRFALGV
jgi:hypothetical protein